MIRVKVKQDTLMIILLIAFSLIVCKIGNVGNSLFAEVEDRRQILLDAMKALQCKYTEMKRKLNVKTIEIDLLRAEKATLIRKWDINVFDALQEDAHLLDKYKSRITDLENKLKIERNSNKQVEEIPSTNDNFK